MRDDVQQQAKIEKPGWMRPLPEEDRRKGLVVVKTMGALRGETEDESELDFEALRPVTFVDELADAVFYGGDELSSMIEKLEERGLTDCHIQDMLCAGREIVDQREKYAASLADWAGYPTSPEMRIAIHNSRDAKKPGRARGTLTVRQWNAICWLWGYRCAYCTDKPNCLTIEHVRPLCDGGRTELGNIVPSCTPCNRSKRTRDVERWLGYQYADFKRRFDAANETAAILSVDVSEREAA